MTDADLLRLYTEAEQRAQGAETAAAYERGRRDALREILERLRDAQRPAETEEPAHGADHPE